MHPGRPLLIQSPQIRLRPVDAQELARIANELSGPTVLSVLSNADPGMNPFAGLDTSACTDAANSKHAVVLEHTAGLVNLLGSGDLHPLGQWPQHLLYLNPPAISLLADPGIFALQARERLLRASGQLLASDSLFALSAGHSLDHGPALQAHEQLRPASWGDLTAGLQVWLSKDIHVTESFTKPAQASTLHITHSWGGGVAQWVESFIDAHSDAAAHAEQTPHRSFQLRSEGPQSGLGAGQRLCLYAGNELNAPIASWWLSPVIRSATDRHAHYVDILDRICQRHGIGRIIVSSLVGHSLDALRTMLPTIQVLHDFFPGWPLLGIHPGPFLELPRHVRLQKAMECHELLPDFRDHDATGWTELAGDWHDAVLEHGVKLIAPSQSAVDLTRKLDTRWEDTAIEVVHHGLAPLEPAQIEPKQIESGQTIAPRLRPDGKLRIVIPGSIHAGKGQLLLLEALPELTRVAQVYLLGAGQHGDVFFGKNGVNVILHYQRSDLPRLLQEIGPDVAALLSVVPETFSYTLSEMRQLGIPVIATRVGSLAERIEDGRDGLLIAPTAQALVTQVKALAQDRAVLDHIRAHLDTVEHFTAAAMVQAYCDLCPARDARPFLAARASLDQTQHAALAEQRARLGMEKTLLDQQVLELQAEIEKRTEWAMERDRALQKAQEDNRVWVNALEAEIQRQQVAHRTSYETLRQRHEEVLHSSSWRLTKPLRATRRVLANLSQARVWNPQRWPLLISQVVRTVSTQGLGGAVLRLQVSPQTRVKPASHPEQNIEPVGDPEPPGSLPRAEKPAVSIVIPVYNKWEYTAACLRSIALTRNAASFEVIVVDDGSKDETPQRLQGIVGLESIRNKTNIGFVGSCNAGGMAARGKYIVLLNNDTQVLDGWLDALLQTFEQFPDTGMAGARLVYPDGSLQEAGGIVFQDGSGWNYGRGDNPDRPEYSYTREVDYCSGACVMLPVALFHQLGGLDQRYAPAYYEDTDLAFQVRAAGFKVRVQAAATIIHHEGITGGTDTGSGTKRFQEINRKKFLERWRTELAAYPKPISDPANAAQVRRARDHRLRGRVLVIDAHTPEPDQDSGSLRLCYLFDCFRQLGYGVSFFADNRGYAGRYSSALQHAGVEVLYNPWIASLQDFFQERGGDFDFIMISRHYVAVNYLSLIQKYCPRARFIFDTVDLHYLREQRLAELENSLPLKRVAAQTRRSELAVIRQADATLVVSPIEKEVLAADAPGARVHVLSNIHLVSGRNADFSARKDIFFVGGFQHPPNVDAVHWFTSSIWPLVRQQLPDIEFHLIGSKAPEKVRALHGNGVVFHGFVQDLEPWLNGCRLAVAPLRYGAGVKGKVNLSMSHGQPVVATPMAAEGLFATDGVDLLIAESAGEFAAAVIRLYQDESLWNRLSTGGLENVRAHFSVEHARENLALILSELAEH